MTDPEPLILCGTDFSDPAREAADVAVALTRALHGQLHLVHAVRPGGEDAQRSQELQREVERLRGDTALSVRGVMPIGEPDAVLETLASSTGARLLVVGSKGAGRSLLQTGGTAERLVQRAKVPVLVVRGGRRLVDWMDGGGLVLGAIVTEDAASERALDWVRAFRGLGPCDVHVLSGYYMDQATRRYGAPPRSLNEPDPEIDGYLQRDLAESVGELGGEGRVTFHSVLAGGRLSDPLVGRATECAADLIVVGNHRARGLARLSAVASGVLHLAPMSVLLVPVEAPPVARVPLPVVRRVLVATDLSPFGNAAIPHARALAPPGGEVLRLHVMTGARDEPAREEACRRLRALVGAEASPAIGLTIEVIWHADVAAAIASTAARTGADCVVIASHGETGLRRLVLGSVAESVVRTSRVPVLIVKPAADT